MDLLLIRHGESTNNALIDNHITFEDAMDLFLIRHGESTNNALDRCQPARRRSRIDR